MKRIRVLVAVLPLAALAGEPTGVDFVRDIHPVLQAECIRCHGPEKAKGGLRLDTARHALLGGDEGPALVPGRPDESPLLLRLVTADADERMPRGADALPPRAVAAVRAWIAAGAPWPADAAARADGQRREWWAFRPLAAVEPPPPTAWARTPVDRFIAAALAERGLQPSAEAGRRRLIRRATFDVTGLPPTPEAVEDFVADTRADAWDRVVDRLLADPAAGERWARTWLDVVRYADSDGYESDYDRPNMHPYRDAVVAAFNRDVPFDRFAAWQVAGDELAPGDPLAVASTGFMAVGPVSVMVSATPTDRLRLRYDELDDQLSTFGAAFLGLTIGCARCHDHKFDPISQEEYYRLLVPFASARRARLALASAERVAAHAAAAAAVERPLAEAHGRLRAWLDGLRDPQAKAIGALEISEAEKLLLRLPPDPDDLEQAMLRDRHEAALGRHGDFRARLDARQRARYAELCAGIIALRARRGPPLPDVLGVADVGAAPGPMRVLERGMIESPGAEVTFGVPAVLDRAAAHPRVRPASLAPQAIADERFGLVSQPATAVAAGSRPSTGQRSALAAWLGDAQGGAGHLMARVLVNRTWQQYFGDGLVATPNDLGTQGGQPSHPALLDWLARRLIADGWSMKALHRSLLLSAAYRQDSRHSPRAAAHDPDNRLLWRQRPRPLEAEALRDAILAVSGALDRRMGGPGVKPPVPPGLVATTSKSPYPRDAADGPAVWRRSLYLFVKRSVPLPMMDLFDRPASNASCGRRTGTVVPTQALLLMNDPFVRRQAGIFAARLAAGAGDAAGRVDLGFRLALGRPVEAVERDAALALLRGQDQRQGLADLALALFELAEFARVE